MSAPAHRIIDRRGGPRPSSLSWDLYATPRNTGQTQYYRPRPYTVQDISRSLDDFTRAELLAYSRQLYAQLGNLGAAVLQKNLYAVGNAWLPQFMGRNTKWGEMAEEWLTNVFYPIADIRGEPFDFQTNLMLDGISLDVDGDAAMILTRAESGFPMLQWIPSHRIASRGSGKEVKGGPYDGATMNQGCITNREGRVIAYRVLGETEADDRDVPANDCQLLYDPEWQSQHRGIPRVARTLLDWFDLQDIDTFLKRGVKLDSSVGLLHYNEEGAAPTALDIIQDKPDGAVNEDVKVERIEGGEIMYFKANRGEKLESFNSNRPSPNTEAFIARLERRGLLAVGWFCELIDPSKIGGASVRLIQDQARHSIRARQKSIAKRAKRAVIYAIARAVKGGFLPENPEPNMDWARWTFTQPSQLTVDEGYSRQADVADLELGLTTKAEVCGKMGRWWEDVDDQRDRETRALIRRAKSIAADEKIEFAVALELLQKRGPNPQPIGATENAPAKTS